MQVCNRLLALFFKRRDRIGGLGQRTVQMPDPTQCRPGSASPTPTSAGQPEQQNTYPVHTGTPRPLRPTLLSLTSWESRQSSREPHTTGKIPCTHLWACMSGVLRISILGFPLSLGLNTPSSFPPGLEKTGGPLELLCVYLCRANLCYCRKLHLGE